MSILDKIAAHKVQEVAERKALYPVKLLEQSLYFYTQPVSMRTYLLEPGRSGIIAEFKRQSPSMGVINPYARVEQTTIGYMQAGASALSVLTDTAFFGGAARDLTEARRFNYCPILRKDFVVDEYQIIEAKSMGADVVLLIAAILDSSQIRHLAGLAVSLGMEVLLELHAEEELNKVVGPIDHVGINNRNLKTFEVNLSHSIKLLEKLPAEATKITESGINRPETVAMLKAAGFNGFLIGEHFMRDSRPERACKKFIQQVEALTQNQPAVPLAF